MDATGEICIINIGPLQRRRRMRWGTAAFAIGVILAAILLGAGFPIAWRLTLLLPLWIGALGVFQARDKT